jgi:hypothetical protein
MVHAAVVHYKDMSDDTDKAARERARFLAFAAVAGLPVVTGTTQSRPPPEPDILCEIQGRGLVAFELVDLIDSTLARTVARTLKGQAGEAVWYGKPPLDIVREKCRKHYETPHPTELVVCAGEEEVELLSPADPSVEDRASQLVERSEFSRVWVVKLTRKESLIWLVQPPP